jgi:hypothetical protein
MDNDEALGKFFDAIPGFCKSQLNQVTLPFLIQMKMKIQEALCGLLERTDSLSKSIKIDHLITCINAAHALFRPEAPSNVFLKPLYEVSQLVKMGHALTCWCTGKTGLISELL